MKVLTKGVYILSKKERKKEKALRLWHDCKKMKLRKRVMKGRPELDLKKDDKDYASYSCKHCGFKYDLDKNLNV